MKKIIAFILVIVCALCVFAGCGKDVELTEEYLLGKWDVVIYGVNSKYTGDYMEDRSSFSYDFKENGVVIEIVKNLYKYEQEYEIKDNELIIYEKNTEDYKQWYEEKYGEKAPDKEIRYVFHIEDGILRTENSSDIEGFDLYKALERAK